MHRPTHTLTRISTRYVSMLTVNIAKLCSRCSPAHHHMANDHDSLCVCVGACMPLCVCMCMCPCMFLSAEDLLLLHLPHYLHPLGDYCRAGRDLRRCVLLSGFQSVARVCAALFYACCFSFFLFSLPACHLSILQPCCRRLILLRALLLASSTQPGFTRIAAAFVCFLPGPTAPGGVAPLLLCIYHVNLSGLLPGSGRMSKWIFIPEKTRDFLASSGRHTAGKVIRNTLKIIGRVHFGGKLQSHFCVCAFDVSTVCGGGRLRVSWKAAMRRDSAESNVIMHFLCCRRWWTQRASCQSCVWTGMFGAARTEKQPLCALGGWWWWGKLK